MKVFLACLGLLLLTSVGYSRQSTMEVSLAYLKADESMDIEQMRPFYADSIRFEDPTGEVFQTSTGGMVVVGRDSLLKLQASWGLDASEFEVDRSFSVGPFAVHNGVYHVAVPGMDDRVHIPFVTFHEIREGKLVSRMDFGEYIESFGLGNQFDAQTQATQRVARHYLAAYTGKDFDTQEALLAEDAVFQDPTAQTLGPSWGQVQETASVIMQRRRTNHPSLLQFSFDITSSFFASRHAVFVGNVSYTVSSGQTFVQPAVFVFEVHDGRVVRHWDFVDYSVPALP